MAASSATATSDLRSKDKQKTSNRSNKRLPASKIIIRNLPSNFTQESFIELIEKHGFSSNCFLYYVPGKFRSGNRHPIPSCAYMSFKKQIDQLKPFISQFNGFELSLAGDDNTKDTISVLEVEPTFCQRIPIRKDRRDLKSGTIEEDPDYILFLSSLSSPPEKLKSAEVQLDAKEHEEKKQIEIPPLLQYLLEQRAKQTNNKTNTKNKNKSNKNNTKNSIKSSGSNSKILNTNTNSNIGKTTNTKTKGKSSKDIGDNRLNEKEISKKLSRKEKNKLKRESRAENKNEEKPKETKGSNHIGSGLEPGSVRIMTAPSSSSSLPLSSLSSSSPPPHPPPPLPSTQSSSSLRPSTVSSSTVSSSSNLTKKNKTKKGNRDIKGKKVYAPKSRPIQEDQQLN